MKPFLILWIICSIGISFAQETSQIDQGKLIYNKNIKSSYLVSGVNYHIYIPNIYEEESNKKFPVIYWLHGSGGWPPGVMEMLARRFDTAITTKKIPPVLVVFLDDGKRESMWVDTKDGSVKMESTIIQELIPHIDNSYRTITDSKGRILEGGSMGGYGSARLGFKYPQLFSAVSLINPGPMQKVLIPKETPIKSEAKAQKVLDRVYGGDKDYFYQQSPWLLAEQNAKKLQDHLEIRIIVGGLDPSRDNVKLFSEHLKKLGIEHEFTIIEEAGHSPKAMFQGLGDWYWKFFNHSLSKATD